MVVEIQKYSRYTNPEIEVSLNKHLDHLKYYTLSSQTYMTSLKKRPHINKWVIVIDNKMYNRKSVISNVLKRKTIARFGGIKRWNDQYRKGLLHHRYRDLESKIDHLENQVSKLREHNTDEVIKEIKLDKRSKK